MFDCCMINSELDLLELRLNLLYSTVEKFVIVESDKTHSGKPKPLHYLENKERFAAFEPKIIHLVFNGYELTDHINAWANEGGQRDKVLEALNICRPSDGLIFLSDADEIPNPAKLLEAKEIALATGMPVSMNLINCMYYMNFVSPAPLRGPYLYAPARAQEVHAMFGQTNFTPSYFRWHMSALGFENDFPVVTDAGWHFSAMGGTEVLRKKIGECAHVEFNSPDIVSDEFLTKCIESGIPYFEKIFAFETNQGRYTKNNDITMLPTYVQSNMEKYSKYIL